jgi:hypothetical protein
MVVSKFQYQLWRWKRQKDEKQNYSVRILSSELNKSATVNKSIGKEKLAMGNGMRLSLAFHDDNLSMSGIPAHSVHLRKEVALPVR